MVEYELYYLDKDLEEYREFAKGSIQLNYKVNRILSDDEFSSVTITKKDKQVS